MRKAEPKIRQYLAKRALYHYYRENRWSEEDLQIMEEFCRKNMTVEGIQKLKLRLLSDENNDKLVAAVISDATQEERIFLHDKYSEGLSYVSIGIKLHIHPNGLQRWRDRFLSELSSLLSFELPLQDMFSLRKTEALVSVLESLIAYHEKFIKYDEWALNELNHRLIRYRNLLDTLQKYAASTKEDTNCRIIRARILNQHMTIEELEQLTGRTHTTIETHIHAFQEQYFPDAKKAG